jgi:tRNA A-37 threonylcarbamoyl transferase component Bud32
MLSGQHKIKINDTTVEKHFIGDMSWWTLDKTNIFNREFEMYKFLDFDVTCPKNVIVPKIISYKDNILILSKCCGKDASSFAKLPEFLNDSKFMGNVFFNIGVEMGKLHSMPITPVIKEVLPDISFGKYLDFVLQHYPQSNILSLKDKLADNDSVILHGDFHPGNIMIDPSSSNNHLVTGIIDFEEAAIGDPIIDLSTMAHGIKYFYPLKCDQLIDSFLSGYESLKTIKKINIDVGLEFKKIRDEFILFWIKKESKNRKINTNLKMWE